MSTASKIEWTETTWNPVTGCDRVSPGCANCYALTMAKRLKAMGNPRYQKDGGTASGPGFGVTMHHDLLAAPLKWRKPRLVFVNSMSDLFHKEVTDEFLDKVFATMALTPQHTYQVLTKRPERMRRYVEAFLSVDRITEEVASATGLSRVDGDSVKVLSWPLHNVWLGVSAENQRWLDERVPVLLDTPADVRFVSCEPLLSGLDIEPYVELRVVSDDDGFGVSTNSYATRLDWVIVGGESGGPGERALVERCPTSTLRHEIRGYECSLCLGTGWRPKSEALGWVRSIRDQCQAAGVPLFFKQWGGPRPKSGGRMLDGRTWDEMPQREASYGSAGVTA